jgi:hypothetical protein
MLQIIQAISIMAEIEHDKVMSIKSLLLSKQDIESELAALNTAKKGGLLLSLNHINNPDFEGTTEQLQTRMTVFNLLRDSYPYNWAIGRAESESIALEHILPEGIKSNDTIAYIGTPTVLCICYDLLQCF